MKPVKLPLRLILALSGVVAAGVWTAGQHFVWPPAPLPTAESARSGKAPQAGKVRSLPPGGGGGGIRIGSQTGVAAAQAPPPPVTLNPAPGNLRESAEASVTARSDAQSESKSLNPTPPAEPRHSASAFASQAETSAAAEAPGFRAMAAGASAQVGGAVVEEPVILEFADHQQLPAVLVADPQTDAADPRLATAQAMAARIAQEFVSEVTAPKPEPSPASDPATDSSSKSRNGSTDASDSATPPSHPAATPEQRWDDAAQVADEQYRLLVGQEVYQQKAIQAAILKSQSSRSEP